MNRHGRNRPEHLPLEVTLPGFPPHVRQGDFLESKSFSEHGRGDWRAVC